MSAAYMGSPSNVERRALRSVKELQAKPVLNKHSKGWSVNGSGSNNFAKACEIAKRIHSRNVKALVCKLNGR